MVNIDEKDIPCGKCVHNKVCSVRKCFAETKINTTHPYILVELRCTEFLDNKPTINIR